MKIVCLIRCRMSFDGVSEVVTAGVHEYSKEKAESYLSSAPKIFQLAGGATGSEGSGVSEDGEDARNVESAPARRRTKPHRGKDK